MSIASATHPEAPTGASQYNRSRDLPIVLGNNAIWGLSVADPTDDFAEFKEFAVDGTFANIQALLAQLRLGAEHSPKRTSGQQLTVLALHAELDILVEQITALVSSPGSHSTNGFLCLDS